jgi:hypothetical protein
LDFFTGGNGGNGGASRWGISLEFLISFALDLKMMWLVTHPPFALFAPVQILLFGFFYRR